MTGFYYSSSKRVIMKNFLNSIKVERPKTNRFDLSHDHKLSFDQGYLIPTMALEVIPGDRITCSAEALVRLAPMVAPIMQRMDVYHHYFFVPYRLLWDKWEMFITDKKDPLFPPAFPTTTIEDTYYGELADHLGIPRPIGANTEVVSALWFSAYQFIWNEFYRDQNLQDEIPYKLTDGDNSLNTDLRDIRKRAWAHDYFTGCLPFAQKGEAVNFPLAVDDFQVSALTTNPADVGNDMLWDIQPPFGPGYDGSAPFEESDTVGGPAGKLFVKGEAVVGETTINELRRATALQRFLEKLARGGSRYTEMIWAMFGVKNPDARLQRPEYITGSKTPVNISEVLNTTGTEDAPQGNMAGHGISYGSGSYGSYFIPEHGVVMCITSCIPQATYQQGIPRAFLKTTDPYQYYFPDFAHIGEQEVLNKEIYAFQGAAGNGTFGYLPRYAEYKTMPSRVSGAFRDTLSYWHQSRIFATPPSLNEEFIECTPRNDIFAVPTEPAKLWAHIQHRVIMSRRMPKFGTPI